MVHLHRPLRDRVHRIAVQIDHRFFEWRIPDRHRIKVRFDPCALSLGRLDVAVAARRVSELLQNFRIHLQHDRLGGTDKTDVLGPVQIRFVGKLVIFLIVREVMRPEAPVLDILFELVRVRRAFAVLIAIFTAPARQRADSGATLMINDIVRIATRKLGLAVVIGHPRQLEPSP